MLAIDEFIHSDPAKRQLELEESRLRLEQQKFLWEISQKSTLSADIVDLVQKTKDFNEVTEKVLIAAIKPTPEPVAVSKSRPVEPVIETQLQTSIPSDTHISNKKKQTVFISYCWKNSVHEFKREGKPAATHAKAGPCDPREIKDILRADGHDVWIDIEFLEDGKSLDEELFQALNKASLVVAFISRQYVMSENCKNEFSFAKKLKLPIVPVIVGNLTDEDWSQSQVGFALGNALYIDARDPSKLAQVKERIKKTVNDKLGIQSETVAKPNEKEHEDDAAVEGDDEEDDDLGGVVNTVVTSEINAIDYDDPKSMDDAIENIRMYLKDTPSLLNEQDSEGRTPLFLAIERIHLEIVEFLLEQPDIDVNLVDNNGQTPLFIACCIDSNDCEVAQKKLKILNLLFKKNADPTILASGRNVLHALAEIGDTNSLIIIIDQFRDLIPDMINHYSENSDLPLELALMNSHIGCAWVLLSVGASSTRLDDAPEDALKPLDYAARGDVRGFRMVLQNGATIPTEEGLNPLHWAALTGNVEVAEVILDAGIPVNLRNHDGETALLIAGSYGHLGFVNFMLERGADPNIKDSAGFDSFLQCSSVEVLESIWKHCNDINQVYSLPDGLFSLVAFAVYVDREEEYVKALIDTGASLTATMPGQKSPLYFAIGSASTSIAKLLVESGAPDFTDPRILNYAASISRLDLIQYLVEKGCDPNLADNLGVHALIAAIEGVDLTEADEIDDVAETTKYLLDAGVSIDVVDPFNGRSPLHVAAINGCVRVVEYLLNRDVDVFVTDSNGMRPLDLTEAKYWDSPELEERKRSIRDMIIKKHPEAAEMKAEPPTYENQDIPSGLWKGHFVKGEEVNGEFECRMRFKDGKIQGSGDCEIGSFLFDGSYEKSVLGFKMQYKFFAKEVTGAYDKVAGTINGSWKYENGIEDEEQKFEMTLV